MGDPAVLVQHFIGLIGSRNKRARAFTSRGVIRKTNGFIFSTSSFAVIISETAVKAVHLLIGAMQTETHSRLRFHRANWLSNYLLIFVPCNLRLGTFIFDVYRVRCTV